MKTILLIIAAAVLSGCESLPSGISVTGPGYAVSYDKTTGIAVAVKPSK